LQKTIENEKKDSSNDGDARGAGRVRRAEVHQESIKDADIQLVDVRTAEEYAEQHIPGAVNIDVYADDFVDQCLNRLDKERPVAVYCRTGKRSASAAEQLRKAGFKKVLNLEGGIVGWIESGKPVNRAPANP
jgi:rhodanese-related sulfurtransferase